MFSNESLLTPCHQQCLAVHTKAAAEVGSRMDHGRAVSISLALGGVCARGLREQLRSDTYKRTTSATDNVALALSSRADHTSRCRAHAVMVYAACHVFLECKMRLAISVSDKGQEGRV